MVTVRWKRKKRPQKSFSRDLILPLFSSLSPLCLCPCYTLLSSLPSFPSNSLSFLDSCWIRNGCLSQTRNFCPSLYHLGWKAGGAVRCLQWPALLLQQGQGTSSYHLNDRGPSLRSRLIMLLRHDIVLEGDLRRQAPR